MNESYILGTALKISVFINRTPSAVTITVRTPSGTIAVNEASMTSETDTVYSYIFQSSNNDTEGEYIAKITVTDGTYTGIEEITFFLRKQSWS